MIHFEIKRAIVDASQQLGWFGSYSSCRREWRLIRAHRYVCVCVCVSTLHENEKKKRVTRVHQRLVRFLSFESLSSDVHSLSLSPMKIYSGRNQWGGNFLSRDTIKNKWNGMERNETSINIETRVMERRKIERFLLLRKQSFSLWDCETRWNIIRSVFPLFFSSN